MAFVAGLHRFPDRELDMLCYRLPGESVYPIAQPDCFDSVDVWSGHHSGCPRGDAETTCQQCTGLDGIPQQDRWMVGWHMFHDWALERSIRSRSS